MGVMHFGKTFLTKNQLYPYNIHYITLQLSLASTKKKHVILSKKIPSYMQVPP